MRMKGERETMSMKSLSGQAVTLLLVVAAVVVGVVVTTATASHDSTHKTIHHHRSKAGIGVFSHHPKRLAHIATAGSVTPPAGAILADVVGRTNVYASHNARGEDCVIQITPGAAGGSVCGRPTVVEEEGVVGIGVEGVGATAPGSAPTLRVTAMVPNGVTSVKFTDRSGSSYTVPVTNNIVEREDINAASVSYALPGGGSQTTNVAAMIDHIPSQPGPPGSSK
jgi:hypothetical protein